MLFDAMFDFINTRNQNKMEGAGIETKIKMSDGYTIPLFGLGGWAMGGVPMYNAILVALKEGYRLLDNAELYGNADVVGRAIKDSNVPRDQLFVVSKLLPDHHGYQSAKDGFQQCLKSLGLDYLDLFLIHSPHGGKNVETWKALIELRDEGLVRTIGVSNYNIQHMEALRAAGLELPTVNQFELHPWNQYKSVVKYCREKNITVMGYCPLARGQYFGTPKCANIDQLAERYEKTPAQILLKWSVQSGFVTIPKSSNEGRIKENADVFDWVLSDEDMEMLNGMDEQGYVGAWNQHMRTLNLK